jgi:hypothetical protein
MQWVVSAIQDNCPKDKPDCTTSERVDAMTVLQNYYGDWKLIGMSATESSGVKAAVIAEDSTKTAITDASTRRLYINQLSDLLNDGFVSYPFLSIDGTDTTKAIPLLFDNTKNSTNATTTAYGINKQATLVKTFNYATSYDIFKLSGSEIPTMLDDALCRKDGKAANCSTSSTLRSKCDNNNTTVACRPAVIVLTENNDRTANMGSGNNIDFSGIENTVTRVKTGMLFKIKAGKWQQAESDDLANEFVAIQQGQPAAANPSAAKLTDTEWNALQQQLILTSITSFANPESNAYPTTLAASLLTGITQKTFDYAPISDWGIANTDIYKKYQTTLNTIFTKLREQSAARIEKTGQYAAISEKGVGTITSGLIQKVNVLGAARFDLDLVIKQIGDPADLAKYKGAGKVAKAGTAMSYIGTALLVAGSITEATGVDPEITKAINISGQAALTASALIGLVSAVKVYNAAKATAGGIKAASTAVSTAANDRPDVEKTLARLKDFQRRTVDRVFQRLYQDASPARWPG